MEILLIQSQPEPDCLSDDAGILLLGLQEVYEEGPSPFEVQKGYKPLAISAEAFCQAGLTATQTPYGISIKTYSDADEKALLEVLKTL